MYLILKYFINNCHLQRVINLLPLVFFSTKIYTHVQISQKETYSKTLFGQEKNFETTYLQQLSMNHILPFLNHILLFLNHILLFLNHILLFLNHILLFLTSYLAFLKSYLAFLESYLAFLKSYLTFLTSYLAFLK